MRIAVIGAGAVGGYFGGRLAAAGEDVIFLARGEHLRALQTTGLRIDSPNGDLAVSPVQATDDLSRIGPVDLVLVGVKAWQVAEVVPAVGSLIHNETVILPLQNGVEAPAQFAAAHGDRHVFVGLCRIVSMVAGPGHIRHLGVDPCVVFGEMDNARTDRVEAINATFDRAGVGTRNPRDIWVALWEKFLFISSFGGVGAVTRANASVMRETPETRELLETAMREIHEVAHAKGIRLPEDAVDRAVAFLEKMPADATASMQRDIMEGRPSELEAQNGTVVRMGKAVGVDTPLHRFIYYSLLSMEAAARTSR